jgi:hypothetical protein
MLLYQVCIDDPDTVSIEGEMDRKIPHQSGLAASAFLACDGYNRHNPIPFGSNVQAFVLSSVIAVKAIFVRWSDPPNV